MSLFRKIFETIENLKIEYQIRHGMFNITDLGHYFFKYCEDLLDHPETQHIEAYDERIESIAEALGLPTEEAIEAIVSTKFIIDINNQD